MSTDRACHNLHAARLAAFGKRLARSGLDGLLIGYSPNVRYLTGFSGSSSLLLALRDGDIVLITDFRYEDQATQQLPSEVRLSIARESLFSELSRQLEAHVSPRRLGFETEHLTVRDRREIGERCGSITWEDAPSIVEEMRRRKGPGEVGTIESAARITDLALEEVLLVVRVGMTEREVAAELEYRLHLAGSGPLPFEPIVAAGPQSALPHADSGGNLLAEGELLLLDFGASVDGYCCDITRTVVLGSPQPWQREVHGAVLEAQEAAISTVAAGTPGREVDRAARQVLKRRGWAERFGHSTGHGIGLEIHEAPRLSRTSEEVLEAGNVVTVEPGVYLSGRGGVRIEDNILVTEEGARVLTRFPRALKEL